MNRRDLLKSVLAVPVVGISGQQVVAQEQPEEPKTPTKLPDFEFLVAPDLHAGDVVWVNYVLKNDRNKGSVYFTNGNVYDPDPICCRVEHAYKDCVVVQILWPSHCVRDAKNCAGVFLTSTQIVFPTKNDFLLSKIHKFRHDQKHAQRTVCACQKNIDELAAQLT